MPYTLDKRHSFGLFIFLHLACVVDCINVILICSALTANEYSLFEYRSILGHYYRNIVSVSKKSGGFTKGLFF